MLERLTKSETEGWLLSPEKGEAEPVGEHSAVLAREGFVPSASGAPARTESRPDTRWRRAWLLLTVALAGHVLDEASTDFLSVYNPTVEALRGSLPWLPLPTFTFETWITGLVAGILLLAVLTPFARGGRVWMRGLSYVYGVFMALNGLGHLGASLMLGRWMPGVVSSPLLMAAALFLLASVPRAGRAR
jgi:hypothetical protein